MTGRCVLCKSQKVGEDSPILVMSALGVPKYLCPECNADMETATLGTDYDSIREAMERIGKRLSASAPDSITLTAVDGILKMSAERAERIREGTYDFSLDSEEGEKEDLSDIPEELLETEEDRALDRKDQEREKKFDKVFNLILIGIGIVAVGLIAYRLIERLF